MKTLIRAATVVLTLTFASLASAQQFNRLVQQPTYGRFVDLKPGCAAAHPTATPYTPVGYAPAGYNNPANYDAYGAAYADPRASYGAAAYAPALPIANRAIRPGGCYGGNTNVGYGRYPYAVPNQGYPGYAGQYPYWTANGRYRNTDEYIGSNLFGAPTRFDRDEPVRNIFRFLLPN